MSDQFQETSTCAPVIANPTTNATERYPARNSTRTCISPAQCRIQDNQEERTTTTTTTTIAPPPPTVRYESPPPHAYDPNYDTGLGTCQRPHHDCDEQADTEDCLIIDDPLEQCYTPEPQGALYHVQPAITPKPPKELQKRRQKDSKIHGVNGEMRNEKHEGTTTTARAPAVKRVDNSILKTDTSRSNGGGQQKPSKRNSKIATTESSGGVKKPYKKDSKKAPSSSTQKLMQPIEPSGKIYYLRRPKARNTNEEWKKPPRLPIKQTATSTLRHENWFAECGKYRVKAYRGNWDQLPADLVKDYDLYERYFKHRREASTRNIPTAKKNGKDAIKAQKAKPKVDVKPFQKRSPVTLAPASKFQANAKSKLRKRSPISSVPGSSTPPSFKHATLPKSRMKISTGYLRKRGARFNLAKKPLIEVKQTKTSELRKNTESAVCNKANKPTFWHGSSQEIEQLREFMKHRRAQIRNEFQNKHHLSPPHRIAETDETAPVVYKSKSKPTKLCTIKPDTTESMNNFIVVSNESTMEESLKNRRTRTNDKAQLSSPTKGTSISRQHSLNRINRKRWDAKVGLDKIYSVTKWMMPPAIPIRQSLTSIMRQASINQSIRNISALNLKKKG